MNLCPGMRYPIKCLQTGGFGSNNVTTPVFAVRNGDNSQIDIIRPDNSRYDFFAGKLNKIGIPRQNFYLVIDEITTEDNDKQFACLNEDNVNNVHDYFMGDHTTVFVPSDEGKEIQA